MTDKPENPPAFPVQGMFNPNTGDYLYGQDGMSLRDWFAGMALQGALGGCCDPEAIDNLADGITGGKRLAKAAYVLADAMLSERTKPNE